MLTFLPAQKRRFIASEDVWCTAGHAGLGLRRQTICSSWVGQVWLGTDVRIRIVEYFAHIKPPAPPHEKIVYRYIVYSCQTDAVASVDRKTTRVNISIFRETARPPPRLQDVCGLSESSYKSFLGKHFNCRYRHNDASVKVCRFLFGSEWKRVSLTRRAMCIIFCSLTSNQKANKREIYPQLRVHRPSTNISLYTVSEDIDINID